MFAKVFLEPMVEFRVFILKNGGKPSVFPLQYKQYIVEENELEEGIFITLYMPLDEFTRFIKNEEQEILFYA